MTDSDRPFTECVYDLCIALIQVISDFYIHFPLDVSINWLIVLQLVAILNLWRSHSKRRCNQTMVKPTSSV